MQTKESISFYYGLANKKIGIDSSYNLDKVEAAYNRLNQTIESAQYPIYGVHTGWGHNVRDKKDPTKWQEDQLELLTYLKVGVGEKLPEKVVRRALRIQALKVSKGYSGTSPQTYTALWRLAESHTIPEIPRYGSLGASGDLVSMAHAIYPLFENKRPQGPRDVISLVNTNSMMTSWGIENYRRLQDMSEQFIKFLGLVSIALDANVDHIDPTGFQMNPQEEPLNVCRLILQARNGFLAENGMEPRREKTCVQERYSFRCAPHILGQIFRNFKYVQRLLEDEASMVSDNPLILEDGSPWHGGHFYAIGVATAADLMADACVRISELIDRNILNLVDPDLSKGLPTNLRVGPYDHTKGLHQLLSSLHQRIKSLQTPSAQMSFSCEGNNQDVVPCGMNAQNQVSDLLDLLKESLRAGLFCAYRGAYQRIGEPLPSRFRLNNWENTTYESFI